MSRTLLKQWIQESKRIVFFGGAGVSTESGIPDFRGTDGIYHQIYDYPPEEILSHHFFQNNPSYFYRFYRNKMLQLDARPNITHHYLAQLEKEGKLSAIITQNIDGLHTRAGNQNVLELHGSVMRNYCSSCGRFYGVEFITEYSDVPRCTCGGIIKPDVVLYEEQLNSQVLQQSIDAISSADMLIVAGTSLTVYPASGLIRYYTGNRLVLINQDPTPYDAYANMVFHAKLGEVFSQL